MKLLSFALVAMSTLSFAACGGDDTSDDDTDSTPIDAAPDTAGNVDAMPDSGGGGACTGAVYEVCTGNGDCTSANCHNYNDIGMVCTQACTPGDNTTCPQPAGGTATCNNMGICKPNAPIACTP